VLRIGGEIITRGIDMCSPKPQALAGKPHI
jgi:hypothetical protein